MLAAEGAAVVFSGRNPDAVAATEAAIKSGGGKVAGVVADMTTRDGALSIVRAARERFGDPDILVVNSPGAVPDRATGRWRGFENSSDDDFEEIYRNFVMSLVYVTRAVLPAMKARGWGRLLNIGSVAMKSPHLEDPMPAVNIRVAVNAVMKTLAQEYGPYGITAERDRDRPVRQRTVPRLPGVGHRASRPRSGTGRCCPPGAGATRLRWGGWPRSCARSGRRS